MGIETALIVGAMVSTVASGALAVKSAADQATVAKGNAKFQERVAQNNAILAERAAQDAEDRGNTEEGRQRLRTKAAIGSSRASAAARGVDVSQGSAQRIVEDIAAAGEEDALTLRENSRREAGSIRQQGANFSLEAERQRLTARNANTARNNQIAATLVNTGTAVASKWYAGV